MSTFTKLEAMPKVKEDIDAKVMSQFRKKLIPTEVVYLRARTKEGQFVAHKSRYTPVNAKLSVLAKEESGKKEEKEEKEKTVSLLTMQWKRVFGHSRGIRNYGNTCFMNSALQCIMNTAPLAQYLIEEEVNCPWSAQRRFCAFCELKKIVKESFDPARTSRAIHPHAIVSNLKQIGPTFKNGRQEDAHELLREILAKSDEKASKHFSTFLEYYPRPIAPLLPGEEPPPKPKPTSLFFAIFGSYLRSRVTCQKCNYNSDTFDPYMDLSIELQGHSLEKSLKHFTSPEELDVDNMYKCGKCKKRTQPIKTLSLWQPPNILTIHLKRFNIFGRKINKQISYPETLDLKPYFAKDSPFASIPSHTYQLYAVLLHHGSTSRSGHYTAMVKASNGVWMDANDEMMSKASKASALNHHDAYILFYSRSDAIPSSTQSTAIDAAAQRKKLEKIQADMIAATALTASSSAPSPAKATPPKGHHLANGKPNGMDVDARKKRANQTSSTSSDSESDDLPARTHARKRMATEMPVASDESSDDDSGSEDSDSESSGDSDSASEDNSSSDSESSEEEIARPARVKVVKPLSAEERKKRAKEAMKSLFGMNASVLQDPTAKKASYDPNVFKARELYGGHMVDAWSFDQADGEKRGASSSMDVDLPETSGSIGNVDAESVIEANLRAKKMANRAMSELQLVAKSRKKKARSAYDIDYDRGKLKKVKRKEEDTPAGASSYGFHGGDRRPASSGRHDSGQNGFSQNGGGFGRGNKDNAFQRRTDEVHKMSKFGEAPKSHSHFKGGSDKVKRLQKEQRKQEQRKKNGGGDNGGAKTKYFKKPFWKSKK